MLSELLKGISDLSVLTRALFYYRYIPVSLPNFAERLFWLSTKGKDASVKPHRLHPQSLVALTENVQSLYNLEEDVSLWKELHDTSLEEGKLAFGVVLISEKAVCRLCGRKLIAKVIRPVNVIVYHDTKGTFMGCCIPKICSNRMCNLTQHYGYYTVGDKNFFDEDWDRHEYFACSRKTVFRMGLLSNMEIEILLGKLSFKEKADIYNAVFGYDEGGGDSDEGNESGEESNER